MKKIFLIGGAGYIGARLVPILLKKNYIVKVYDIFFFKNKLKKHKNLKIVKGDIRNISKLHKEMKGYQILIHLACLSNDPSANIDKEFTKSINLNCFEDIVISAKNLNFERFIYASSASVYGISNKKNVKENHPLKPLTIYSKCKKACEKILQKYSTNNFATIIFRPATVCGYSPRMRFDLSVNILTNHAYNNSKIKIFGGNQLRPNLHILDYCRAVLFLIKADKKKVNKEIFNVGNENYSINQIANIVKKTVELKTRKKITFVREKTNDKRSYHINSDRIYKKLKFKTKENIKSAIIEVINALKRKEFKNTLKSKEYFNIEIVKRTLN